MECDAWAVRLVRNVECDVVSAMSMDLRCLDPSVLACFGNMNSGEDEFPAGSDSDFSGMETSCGSLRSCRSEKQSHLPRMSGFLTKRSTSLSPSRLFRPWKTRWFVLTPHRSGAMLQYYKKDSYDAPAKTLIIGSSGRGQREAGYDSNDRFCFSFPEHGSGIRMILSATSESQANAWVSCINNLVAESLQFSRAASM